jgi:hypothetical protein
MTHLTNRTKQEGTETQTLLSFTTELMSASKRGKLRDQIGCRLNAYQTSRRCLPSQPMTNHEDKQTSGRHFRSLLCAVISWGKRAQIFVAFSRNVNPA